MGKHSKNTEPDYLDWVNHPARQRFISYMFRWVYRKGQPHGRHKEA